MTIQNKNYITLKEKLKTSNYYFFPSAKLEENCFYDEHISKEIGESHRRFENFIDTFPLLFQEDFYKNTSLLFTEFSKSEEDPHSLGLNKGKENIKKEKSLKFLYMTPWNLGNRQNNFINLNFNNMEYLDKVSPKIKSIKKVKIDSENVKWNFLNGASYYDIRMKDLNSSYFSFRIPVMSDDPKSFSWGKNLEEIFNYSCWHQDLGKKLGGE